MTFRPKLVTLNLVGQKTSCPNVIQPDDLSNASAAKKMCCAWVVYRGRRSSRRRVRLSIKRPHIRRPSSDGAGAFLFDCFRWVEKAATHLHRLPKSRAFHVNVAAAAEYFSLRAAIVLIARQHLTEWTKDLGSIWFHQLLGEISTVERNRLLLDWFTWSLKQLEMYVNGPLIFDEKMTWAEMVTADRMSTGAHWRARCPISV